MKLWQTQTSADDAVKNAVDQFTVGDDYLLDRRLVAWDCYGSMAHAVMLNSIGIISDAELKTVRQGLSEILNLAEAGKFEIAVSDEDCHTAIENYLTKQHGEVGKKIHTARSRNDQSLTVTKLFLKDALFRLSNLAYELAKRLLEFAEKNPVPMPGYTHMQKGMPSTVQLWAASFVESILDTAGLLLGAVDFIDSSPLGSAAGYGVTIPINREMTADLLDFARVQRNVISAANSRGKNELVATSALTALMTDLGKLGADLIFFSQRELGFLILPERFCTGSSIMPQKRNPDVLELLRAKAKVVSALHAQILAIITDLPSGYNRDFQLTKGPALQAIDIVSDALTIMTALIQELKVDPERCNQAMEPELFAADIANELVAGGKSFRDAYREVKDGLSALRVENPSQFIERKTHTGATGNPGLGELGKELLKADDALKINRSKFESRLQQLFTQQ